MANKLEIEDGLAHCSSPAVFGDPSPVNGTRKRAAWYVADFNPRKAGFRYRCLYPMESLKKRGFDVSIFKHGQRYDVVVFDAWDLFSSNSKSIETLVNVWEEMGKLGIRRVLDNCDNQFAGQAVDTWSVGCHLFRRLASEADLVTTCSYYLADVIRSHCDLKRFPEVVFDPVETKIIYPGDSIVRSFFSIRRKLSWARYLRHRLWLKKSRTPLVWFGFHGVDLLESGMSNLESLRAVLEAIDRDFPISLTIISNNRHKFDRLFLDWSFPVAYVEWDRVTFLSIMRLHKICLLPAKINPYSAAKSANRLVTAIGNDLNVVCDAVPSYLLFSEVVQIGNFEEGIRLYLENKEAAARDLVLAKAIINENYTLPIVAEKWRTILFDC